MTPLPSQWQQYVRNDRDKGGLLRTFGALLGLPENLLRPVPDTACRSLTLAETEMLRNLNKEFRGNELRSFDAGAEYSRLVCDGAVMHMENACSPSVTRGRGDHHPLSAVPGPQVRQTYAEPRTAPEAAARTLYGALTGAAAAPVRHTDPAKARTVHQDAFEGTREGARPPSSQAAAVPLSRSGVTRPSELPVKSLTAIPPASRTDSSVTGGAR